jgi:membrane protein required for colicin V production
MPMLDWILLAVLGVSLLLGAWRGLVYEVLSVLVWVAAFIVAQWFAPDVASRLPLSGVSDAVRYVIAFALVFIGVAFTGGLLASLVKKLVDAVGLRPVDRTMGALFGLVRGLVLLLALAVVMDLTPLKNSVWWRESVGAGLLTTALKDLRPMLPEGMGRFLV